MKKEIIYLSLPDYFNKMLLCNYNQKFSTKKSISFFFKFTTANHLGLSIKAILLLETIYPQKPCYIKILLRKRNAFGQKVSKSNLFILNVSISQFKFIEFFRFFSTIPLNSKISKTTDLTVINKRFKQFLFNKPIFFDFNQCNNMIFHYHLN